MHWIFEVFEICCLTFLNWDILQHLPPSIDLLAVPTVLTSCYILQEKNGPLGGQETKVCGLILRALCALVQKPPSGREQLSHPGQIAVYSLLQGMG